MTRPTIFSLFCAFCLATFLSLVPLALPSTALACKCMIGTVEAGREAAAAVFEGRVTAIEHVAPGEGEGGGKNRVTLGIVRTWKGLENKESIVISTSDSSASCGVTFEPNTSYLVYADGTEAAMEVSGCSRTRPMADASEDLGVLGAGITPVDVKPAPAPESKPATAPKTGGCGSVKGAAQASASLLLLPATGLVLGTRRRRR